MPLFIALFILLLGVRWFSLDIVDTKLSPSAQEKISTGNPSLESCEKTWDISWSVCVWSCPEKIPEKEHPGTYYKSKIISRKPAVNGAFEIIDGSRLSYLHKKPVSWINTPHGTLQKLEDDLLCLTNRYVVSVYLHPGTVRDNQSNNFFGKQNERYRTSGFPGEGRWHSCHIHF